MRAAGRRFDLGSAGGIKRFASVDRPGVRTIAAMPGKIHTWLYVSNSALSESEAPEAVDAIVAVSRPRNETLDVTGALLFSGTRFVQFLEGPMGGVAALQSSIRSDPRHFDVRTFSVRMATKRIFPDWRLAYDGVSPFVEKVLDQAIAQHGAGSRDGVDGLIKLLQKFS
jgi:hypothetical protein